MGDVVVKSAVVKDGRIETMKVGIHGLPDRSIDRDTAISWMRDGHSMIPVRSGTRLTALQLVEAEDALFVRHDNNAVAEDNLPI